MTPAHRLSLLTAESTWRGRALSGRAVDLLAVLAGGEDAWTGDGALIAALWPDDPPAHPLRALHVVVSRARALVGEGVVERVGDGYRLALPVAAVDARDLADRAVRARASADASRWDRVLELTDDLPMPAEADADDVAPVADAAPLAVLRERAARHAWRARRDRALALEATGECERALPLLRAAARRDGSDEAVLAALMRAVSWTRSPAAALEIYEDHRRRLREQGAVPGPALRAAHEAVLAAENPVRRGLVPVPDHFLGREDDVAGVLGALSTHRLVTITGPGGVGKTTLARAVAARSRRPAVYAVALAEVDSGVDLLRAILNAVGSPLAADADPRAVVRAVLAPPGTLLILDNCEHLADEVADLVGPLLVGCPDLRVLATSRRRLDLGAEHVHRLEPLDAAAAAGLFRARALAARPDQVIDDGDLEALLGRVEGIPLAIELAAARTRTLSVGQIAARLPGRPGMLTGARDAPTRQRTLTAVIEWSWNLLDVSERHALARLALLADGFTLGAAEAVVGPEAPDLLDALVTHSLLIVRDRGLPRFHMLVTVRDVVLSRLADSGDEVRARRALRDWALEVCSQVRLPVGAGDFGDADHPQAERHDRVFRRLMDDEAVVLQELDRLLEQADGADAGVNADLRDAICLIGAALLRLWSVTWGYERVAGYGPRLIRVAAQPAGGLRGNEAGLAVLALCATSGLLPPLSAEIRSSLRRSFDGEGDMAAVRRFLLAPAGQWPELIADREPWVARAAGRCLATELENEGRPDAALDVIEALLDRLQGAGLAGIDMFELQTHRLQILMSLGRYDRVVEACARALALLDRILPSWGGGYRTALRLEQFYCTVCLDPRQEAAEKHLTMLEATDFPGTLRFIFYSVRGELELMLGRPREAALIQRVSLRYAGRWRTVMGAGSPWELYVLGMCLVTDVELDQGDAVELDAAGVRARAVPLLRDMLTDSAPQQRDIPTIMALAAAVGLSTMAGAQAGPQQQGLGAELLATALAVGANQTCRLLSHRYLRERAGSVDARVLADAEERIRPLDRVRLIAHAGGLARRLAGEAARSDHRPDPSMSSSVQRPWPGRAVRRCAAGSGSPSTGP